MIAKARAMMLSALDQLADAEALLAGEQTKGQRAGEILRQFIGAWERRYHGQKYATSAARDIGMVKRLLGQLQPEDIQRRIGRFILSDDPYFTRTRHQLGTFVAQINRFADAPRELPSDRLFDDDDDDDFDCNHEPRCKSVVAHTTRLARRRG